MKSTKELEEWLVWSLGKEMGEEEQRNVEWWKQAVKQERVKSLNSYNHSKNLWPLIITPSNFPLFYNFDIIFVLFVLLFSCLGSKFLLVFSCHLTYFFILFTFWSVSFSLFLFFILTLLCFLVFTFLKLFSLLVCQLSLSVSQLLLLFCATHYSGSEESARVSILPEQTIIFFP